MEAAAIQGIPLRGIFTENRVLTFSEDVQRDNVLRELVKTIVASGKLADTRIESTVEELVRREFVGSTGIGRGLAFPHLRTEAVTEHVGAIAMAPDGIDFDSLDKSPTLLVFLLLSPPNSAQEHTDIMGRLARLMSDHTLQYILRIPRSAENLFQILEF
jgi:PTS system fructose-specific IIA component/PTS system nitrogen regulatory IIA component